MSRLAHRRRSLPGKPYQIPYSKPSHPRQSTQLEVPTSQNFVAGDISADADRAAAAVHTSGSLDSSDVKKKSHRLHPGRVAGAGDSRGTRPSRRWQQQQQLSRRKPRRRRRQQQQQQRKQQTESSARATPLVIDTQRGSGAELIADDLKLKRFMLRLEDETLKLLEPTEEGIKVPRPIPYPHYLSRPPEIPISQTYTTVLRRLYNEKRTLFTRPDFPLATREYPKKPNVPPYLQSDLVEQRQKTVKLLLKSQEEDADDDDENDGTRRNLMMVEFGQLAKRRRLKKLH